MRRGFLATALILIAFTAGTRVQHPPGPDRQQVDVQSEQITSEMHSMVRFLLGTLHQQAMISSDERKM